MGINRVPVVPVWCNRPTISCWHFDGTLHLSCVALDKKRLRSWAIPILYNSACWYSLGHIPNDSWCTQSDSLSFLPRMPRGGMMSCHRTGNERCWEACRRSFKLGDTKNKWRFHGKHGWTMATCQKFFSAEEAGSPWKMALTETGVVVKLMIWCVSACKCAGCDILGNSGSRHVGRVATRELNRGAGCFALVKGCL